MPGGYSFKRNFLFDLDGTLVDSTEAHARAYVDALRPAHPKLADGFDYARVAGQPTRQVFTELGFAELELAKLTAVKQGFFRAALERGEVKLFAGAMLLLEQLRQQKKRLFLVTGASRISAQRTLEKTETADFFEAIITGDDGAEGKPSPGPYLRILDSQQLRRKECLAIEDGESGVRSAQGAEVDVVLLHSMLELPGVARVQNCAKLAQMLLL
jgi:HAD superfamily hydrolase (TIGR01509 family)